MSSLDFLGQRVRSLVFATYRDFRHMLTSRRFIVLTAIVVAVLALMDARLAALAAASRATDPLAVWDRGADGSFVAFAVGLLPIFLPTLPILLGYNTLERDLAGGYSETAMTRRAPRWTVAVGKFLGALLAIAVAIGILVAVAALLTQLMIGGAPSGGLLVAVFVGAILLCALYLGLVFLLAAFLTSTFAGIGTFFAWILFNVVRNTAFVLSGQAVLILRITERQTYEASWSDLASFTGLYQGFLAHFVPDSLHFASRASLADLSGALAYYGIAMAGFPWVGVVLALYIYVRAKMPLGA